MSTPVVTNEWAGNLECTGPCRRKRLMGEAFSKKMMERHLKQGAPLKCKQCMEAAQAAEREAAAKKQQQQSAQSSSSNNTNGNQAEAHRVCAACQKFLPESAYNKNQWRNKPEGQAKCRTCVEQQLKDDQSAQSSAHATKLAEAQRAVAEAKTPMEKLKAESRLSALQAEKVTGLKPVRMSGGRGGRGGRRSGRGAGRSGRAGR